jgi:hypothetical protein
MEKERGAILLFCPGHHTRQTTRNNDQPYIYVLEGASNQVQRIIGQNFFLKSGINFIIQLFYQTEFKPISKRQVETSAAMHV